MCSLSIIAFSWSVSAADFLIFINKKFNMKYFLALLFGMLLMGVVHAQQIKVIPRAGLNLSTVTSEVPDIDPDGIGTGFHLGVDLRMGDYDGWFFFQPGLHYYNSSVSLSAAGFNNMRVSDDVDVRSIKIPLNGGLYLTGTDGILRFSANAGIVPTVVFGVGDANIDPDYTDFRTFGLGANAGVGLDIAILSVNIGYEYGLSRVFKSGDGRQNIITMTVGLVIPPTF